ncbi:hypothetical protein [Paracoccus sp. (in: a-proteobacteria)]|uniref:hypothetical protein n=1 Tax=Paracoccus sp. TaxID=267 RepID=UPI003A8513BD
MMAKHKISSDEYEVTQSREIGGVYRATGQRITMTPAQAKYYLPPCGSGIRPVMPKAALSPDGDT